MKLVYNKIIPFPGFKAINLFGILFIRKGAEVSEKTLRHETIHTYQMKELLYIFFYIWYVLEWFVRLFQYKFTHEAYRNICFEREAFTNQLDKDYLYKNRKRFAFLKYL